MFNIFKHKANRIHNLEVEVYTLSDMNIEARLANLERRSKRLEQDYAELGEMFINVISQSARVIQGVEVIMKDKSKKPTPKKTTKTTKTTKK